MAWPSNCRIGPQVCGRGVGCTEENEQQDPWTSEQGNEHHGLSLFTCDEEPAERFVNLFFEARIVTDEDELVIYGVRSVRGNIMC